MTDELEPCPFCGVVGLDFADGSTHRWGLASCSGCGATCGEVRREYPDTGAWHAEAIKQWNTRAIPADGPVVPNWGGDPSVQDYSSTVDAAERHARCLAIGMALEHAAEALPEGYEVRVCAERNAGWVHLIDENGENVAPDFSDEDLGGRVELCITAAIAATKKD